MSRYWPTLFLLAAIWGASYVCIKVAVRDIEPAPMMAIRALGAGLVLLAYLVVTTGGAPSVAELRRHWRPALVLGTINAAIPFWLIAWGEKHIDSSVAGIAQATVPIFTFLLAARFLPHEPVGLTRKLGVAVGFVGVAVLAGFDPDVGWLAVAGTLAVVLSSFFYGMAGVYGQHSVRSAPGPVLATGSMLAGGLILLPFALLQLPTHGPDGATVASVLVLTLLGTALAQLILFRMLRLYGSRRLSLVTYLIPGFAVFYGAVLLDEPVTVAALGGLVLILGGVALASGQQLLRARADAREEPA
ncbi:MAG: DMT family transporter [Actinomycetota bacterium]|nr:DMT family transporter [Actinomycetota bacterium]